MSLTSARPRLEAWALRAPLRPALRRAAWSALPVALAILLDLSYDAPVAGALSTGALLTGFVAFDAPARVRLLWQLIVAPLVGVAGAIGVLSDGSAALAVVVMTVVAIPAGYCIAVSMRLAIAAMTCVLALLIAQGLQLETQQAVQALLLGTAGVATYRLAGFGEHGYWIPLTILFVLKPELGDTIERVAMRAVGTIAGLLLATGLAPALAGHPVPAAIALGIAAAFALALLAIEYALFTFAVTTFIVLMADVLGESALDAAGQRGAATAIGIAIAVLAILAWPSQPRSDHAVKAAPIAD